MMEQLLEADESVLHTPYLRRHRNELETAKAQANILWAQAKRDDILEVVAVKLNPPATVYREIEKQVAQISNPVYLNEIFSAALQTDNLADVQRVLANALADE